MFFLLEMTEKAITFRYPSTANLMIDSFDRNAAQYPSPFHFQITKPQALQNGFFTRIGTCEVVLEWQEPNVSAVLGNTILTVDISGATGDISGHQVVFPTGFWTVKQILDYLASELTDLSGTTGSTFSVVSVPPTYGLEISAGSFTILEGGINNNLTLLTDVSGSVNVPVSPDLRPYRYLDFVSNDLTYNQDLKDNATSIFNRDVLCRWYFAEDVPEEVDAYGFPIFMGYRPFNRRRLYNPPKQIKWSAQQPIGNLSFDVYDELGRLVGNSGNGTDWLMTLQLSES
jgi:hypothetical protein